MLSEINEEQLDLVIGLLQSYLLYAVIALVVIIAAIAVIIKIKNPDKLKQFASIATGVIVGFSLCIIFSIMALTLARYTLKGRINTNFWLSTALVIAVVIAGIAAYVLKAVNSKAFKPFLLAAIALIAVYSIVLIIVLPATDAAYDPANSPIGGSATSKNVIYYGLSALLVAVLILVAVFGKKTDKCRDAFHHIRGGVYRHQFRSVIRQIFRTAPSRLRNACVVRSHHVVFLYVRRAQRRIVRHNIRLFAVYAVAAVLSAHAILPGLSDRFRFYRFCGNIPRQV